MMPPDALIVDILIFFEPLRSRAIIMCDTVSIRIKIYRYINDSIITIFDGSPRLPAARIRSPKRVVDTSVIVAKKDKNARKRIRIIKLLKIYLFLAGLSSKTQKF